MNRDNGKEIKERFYSKIMFDEILKYKIDTPDKLQKLVDLIFDKAVKDDDPQIYFFLCNKIISRSYFPLDYLYNFKERFIAKCNNEFELKVKEKYVSRKYNLIIE